MTLRSSRSAALSLAAALLAAGSAPAQLTSLNEDFGNVPGLFTAANPWVNINRSTTQGTNSTWFQGNPAVFNAQAGATNSYAGANFNATTGADTISLWLLTPELNLTQGSTFSFFTRTITAPAFPDRMQVRFSTAAASTDVGLTDNSVGVFTNLLDDINGGLTTTGYPNDWTQFSYNIPAQLGTGRLAFRYFVPNGGPAGANSDFIGVDSTIFVVVPVPEPGCVLLAGALGLAGFARRRFARTADATRGVVGPA